jgi:predicted RND superfamily exporter protein
VTRNDRPPPPKPTPPSAEKPRGSIWTVILAFVFGVVMFLGLAVVAGPFMPVVLAIGGILLIVMGVAAGHYLLWGYWLSDSIRREVEEEERNQSRDQ